MNSISRMIWNLEIEIEVFIKNCLSKNSDNKKTFTRVDVVNIVLLNHSTVEWDFNLFIFPSDQFNFTINGNSVIKGQAQFPQ